MRLNAPVSVRLAPFRGIVGSHSTPRAVWPIGAWRQAVTSISLQ